MHELEHAYQDLLGLLGQYKKCPAPDSKIAPDFAEFDAMNAENRFLKKAERPLRATYDGMQYR